MYTRGKWVIEKHEENSQWYGNIIIEKGKVDKIMSIRTVACLCKHGTEKEQEANAKRIVQCVNSFPLLVEALKDLIVYCRGNLTSQLEPLLKRAENALKQAESEE